MALNFSLHLASVVCGAVDPKFAHGPRGKAPFFPRPRTIIKCKEHARLPSPPCCSMTPPTLDGIRVIRSPQINDLGTGRALCVSLRTGCVTANGPSRKRSDKSPRSGWRYTLHMCMMAAVDMCMQCMVRDRAQEISIWIRVLTKCLPKTFIRMWSPFQHNVLG